MILSQEKESFERTSLGIKSLEMLLMSSPKNSPSHPTNSGVFFSVGRV